MNEKIKVFLMFSIPLSIGLFLITFLCSLSFYFFYSEFFDWFFTFKLSIFMFLITYPIVAIVLFLGIPLLDFIWNKLEGVLK